MRIVVTGGGTGGHIFPALEIVKEIKRQNDRIQVIFVGNTNSLEEKLAKASEVPFFGLSVKKLVGQSLVRKALALIYLKIAIFKSMWFLFKHKPDAVIGVGGYVSAPMILASFLLHKKRFICEQNVVPGLANRMLAKIAHRVFISFKESKSFFPQEKTVLTGNPVRREFFTVEKETLPPKIRVLITGGSLGAYFLNREIPKVFKHLNAPFEITHQTGASMCPEVAQFYKDEKINAEVVPFIDNMPQAFLNHDLLISRAGATVCAEITASGMPAILIPYPHAHGHQKFNAEALAQSDAAIMIEENQNFVNQLAFTLKKIHTEPNILAEMGKKAKSMGMGNAAYLIVNNVLENLRFH